jgi:hypothetical protein
VRDATGLPVVLLHHLAGDDGMSWGRDVARDADIILTMKSDEERTELPSAENHWIGDWINVIGAEKVRDGMAGFSVSCRFVKETQTFEPVTKPAEQRTDWLTTYYMTLVKRHSAKKVVRHLVSIIVKRQKESDFAGLEVGP